MMNTRHIDKNGLSFDCPDYYGIGKFPSSDDAHKAIVGLSNYNRKFELYIMVYRRNKFDNNAKQNTNLIKEYLRLQNYNNITINKNLPYCFNANKIYNGSNIKTTIVFDFNHDEVIAIAGNALSSSNYDCIDDLKVILNSLSYTNKNPTYIFIAAIILFIIAIFFYSLAFFFSTALVIYGLYLMNK